MPETSLTVRWPDASERSYYSPSTCVHRHLPPGMSLPVEDFLRLGRRAFSEASERVAAKYGFACTGAAASLSELEADGQAHASGEVEVLPGD